MKLQFKQAHPAHVTCGKVDSVTLIDFYMVFCHLFKEWLSQEEERKK